MAAKQISDGEFEGQVLGGTGYILVDFWAEWCNPCKQLAPILDEIAQEMQEKVTVMKINIDQNPDTPTKYGVRGIPTLMLFKDGKPVATKVGSLPKSQLKDWLDSQAA